MVAAMKDIGIIAVNVDDDSDINKKAVGSIIFWALSGGNLSLAALTDALTAATSKAKPPPEVTAKVALHRAVESVAKELGCEPLLLAAKQVEQAADEKKKYQPKRGDWAIVRKPRERLAEDGPAVEYPIIASARVEDGVLKVSVSSDPTVAGDIESRLHTAFVAAKGVLAPSDIGHWLCEKLRGLDAVPLKDSGGVYFIPRDIKEKWDKVCTALKACSGHQVFGVPSMRSKDAVDAILAAVAAETRAECDKIATEIADAGLGRRALESRETTTTELLGRLGRYENLLGTRLDELRDAIDGARAAVATAKMALGTEDA